MEILTRDDTEHGKHYVLLDDVTGHIAEIKEKLHFAKAASSKLWIDVSDCLPQRSAKYLTYSHEPNTQGLPNHSICATWFSPKSLSCKEVWHSGEGVVTHWMPLPEPPK